MAPTLTVRTRKDLYMPNKPVVAFPPPVRALVAGRH